MQFSSQWGHNGRDGVSNHQPHDCLLIRFSDADQRKHQSSKSLTSVRGIHRWAVNSPHKGAVTRKFLHLMTPWCDFLPKWTQKLAVKHFKREINSCHRASLCLVCRINSYAEIPTTNVTSADYLGVVYYNRILLLCITVARWHLKSPASRLFTGPFTQGQIKENIKAPRQWPLWGEFIGDRRLPRTKGQ